MPPKGFKCKQCGNCCLNLYDAFQTSVTDEDVELWEQEGRWDILEWVDSIPLGDGQFVHGCPILLEPISKWICFVSSSVKIKCPGCTGYQSPDKEVSFFPHVLVLAGIPFIISNPMSAGWMDEIHTTGRYRYYCQPGLPGFHDLG